MPLKPIFDKAPLKSAVMLPMRPGQLQVANAQAEALLDLCAGYDKDVRLWEGQLRLSALLNAHAEKLPVAEKITAALGEQQEDGSLPYSLTDSLAIMRAAYALYECTAQRSLAERIARWCGYLASAWESVLADNAIRQSPADLMELLENMYRVGGKKPMLVLLEKLRSSAMDWSGVLHTYSVQHPMSRVTPWADLSAGLAAEDGNEQGFYTRQALICHGEALADGARTALLNGAFSGNGQELSACKAGWERLTRYHGAICGGICCDEMVAGASPAAGIDAAALGAWTEALCASAEAGDAAWAWDALDTLLANALPRTLLDGKLQDLLRVNSLSAAPGDAGAYHLHEGTERTVRALVRLIRGYAAALSHAVTMRKDGIDVNLLQDARCTVALPAGMLSLVMKDGQIIVRTKQPIHTAIRVRIPEGTEAAAVTVNDGKTDTGAAGSWVTVDRTWQDGDVISVSWKETLRVKEGHHRGLYVTLGHTLLVMPADKNTNWAVAMLGQPVCQADGTVTCTVSALADWKRRGDLPADLPVLPAAKGEQLTVTLKPWRSYAGIALFPQGQKS